MKPDVMLTQIMDPGMKILRGLGGPKESNEARVFLLAVTLQESGPDLAARYQNSPSSSVGPARGWWQFEQGGGVRGVMNHATSKKVARDLADACFVQWNEAAVWRAIEGHDVLAVGFARSLLWTDPFNIPISQVPAWQKCGRGIGRRQWRPSATTPWRWSDEGAGRRRGVPRAGSLRPIASERAEPIRIADRARRRWRDRFGRADRLPPDPRRRRAGAGGHQRSHGRG